MAFEWLGVSIYPMGFVNWVFKEGSTIIMAYCKYVYGRRNVMAINFSSDLIIRLAVATLLGGILGLEREIHGRPAGLRTHLLVSLGAAAFTLMSPMIAGMICGRPRTHCCSNCHWNRFSGSWSNCQGRSQYSRADYCCLPLGSCRYWYGLRSWSFYSSFHNFCYGNFCVGFIAVS